MRTEVLSGWGGDPFKLGFSVPGYHCSDYIVAGRWMENPAAHFRLIRQACPFTSCGLRMETDAAAFGVSHDGFGSECMFGLVYAAPRSWDRRAGGRYLAAASDPYNGDQETGAGPALFAVNENGEPHVFETLDEAEAAAFALADYIAEDWREHDAQAEAEIRAEAEAAEADYETAAEEALEAMARTTEAADAACFKDLAQAWDAAARSLRLALNARAVG